MALGLSQADADCAAMVAERNLGEFFLDNASNLAIEEALQKLTHIRLDREKLVSLDSCQYFLALPSLTNLYLQENNLKSLKGLEIAKNLKFLTVAGNHITKLEGLSSLFQLMVLDVSNNNIIKINAEKELPKSLSFLNIVGNPCWQPQLREYLKIALPNLKELDGDALTDDECTSESGSLESKVESNPNDQSSHTNEKDDELICREDQEGNQQAPKDQSFIFAKELRTTSPALQQIQILSSLTRLTTYDTHLEGLDSRSIGSESEVGSKDAEDLKECLYKANLEPEFALQKILAMTTGSLDYPTMAIMERIAERVKNLDGQISQEIVDLFFSPWSSSKFSAETTSILENCEVSSLTEKQEQQPE